MLKPEQKDLIKLLQSHGIVVEATMKDEALDVERYSIKKLDRAQRAFQGHRETRLTVSASDAQEKFPAGSFIVSMHQPKAALIFYLLEAESDDGLVNWNYLDQELDRAVKEGGSGVYPVYRLKSLPKLSRQIFK